MRRRRPGSRSKRYKRRLPGVLGWSLGVLVGLAALVAIAYVHGKADTDQDFLASLHTTLAKPAVAGAVAFAAVLLLAWGVRHLLLEFVAWWPGRIIVGEFVAGPEVEGADVARLTAEFRERLVRSHLQSPAPVPAPAQQGDFLDVLTNGTVDPGNPLATLLSVLQAARHTHAYEVKGALVTREAAPGLRGDGPRGAPAGQGRSGPDVLGLLLGCGDPPGGRPRDRPDPAAHATVPLALVGPAGLPPAVEALPLLRAGGRARAGTPLRRGARPLLKALEQDPMNLGLRLQIGFLQEKLALFVDALATYESILEVARPGRNAWAPSPGTPRRPRSPPTIPRTSCSAVVRAAIA
jgi:hypothetical protein